MITSLGETLSNIREKCLPDNAMKTWSGAINHSFMMSIAVILSVLLNLILGASLAFRQPTITVNPPNMSESYQVIGNKATGSWKVSWADFIASRLGNANVRTLNATLDVLEPMIRDQNKFEELARQLEDHVTALDLHDHEQTFEPKTGYYDIKKNVVIIYGNRKITPRSTTSEGRPIPIRWTYEITIDNTTDGNPELIDIQQYEGAPDIERHRIIKSDEKE
ncbi:TraE/TraK family type IV conjugative transfer system protein [Enterovibrio norvegicus]|uniref:TraE/TraK family type IV conjugative transfer system protein n=1 Tax=Enterovibrio norvegicus TaxID=188144 RepID=UPI00352CC5FA